MNSNNQKQELLVISHVLPFPKDSGQSMRVYYTLLAARRYFNITFLSLEPVGDKEKIEEELEALCSRVILLKELYKSNPVLRLVLKAIGEFYSLITGLKFSNFLIGKIELTPRRVSKAISGRHFDLVLYEYWHAYRTVDVFSGIHKTPCILDTHNVLLSTYLQHHNKAMPSFIRTYMAGRYSAAEKKAWKKFNGIISINKNEYNLIKNTVPSSTKMFLIEMGVDLSLWPYIWQPSSKPAMAYYGGLGSVHNRQGAIFCAEKIMPLIWKKYPEIELWIIGSNPNEEILALQHDTRVHVTGYVDHVQHALKNAQVFLCPWEGKYGFRSRVVEIMASGLPVVTSPDAVDGISLSEGKGLLFAKDAAGFAEMALRLIDDIELLQQQSLEARRQIEENYSFEQTYLKGIAEIKTAFLA